MKKQANNFEVRNIYKQCVILLLLGIVSGCTSYKNSWSCPNAKGIGCSSLEYADEVARKQILLNKARLSDISSKSYNMKEIQPSDENENGNKNITKQDLDTAVFLLKTDSLGNAEYSEALEEESQIDDDLY